MPFAFNSRWRSSKTGLVNMRARWYSPKLGQFTSHDPFGYVDTQNLYAFAAFDPINAWDPYGREQWTYHVNPGDGSPSPFAGGVKRPEAGNVKILVTSRRLNAWYHVFGYRHTHVTFIFHNWQDPTLTFEVQNSAGKEAEVRNRMSIPDIPGESQFEAKWQQKTKQKEPGKYMNREVDKSPPPQGLIEWVAETEVDRDDAERVIQRVETERTRQLELTRKKGRASDEFSDPENLNPDYTGFGTSDGSFEANCNNFTSSVCADLGVSAPMRDADKHPGIETPFGPKEWEQERKSRGAESPKTSRTEKGQAD